MNLKRIHRERLDRQLDAMHNDVPDPEQPERDPKDEDMCAVGPCRRDRMAGGLMCADCLDDRDQRRGWL